MRKGGDNPVSALGRGDGAKHGADRAEPCSLGPPLFGRFHALEKTVRAFGGASTATSPSWAGSTRA
eukprot:3983543-Alexandrium_andersonii.AAC.1